MPLIALVLGRAVFSDPSLRIRLPLLVYTVFFSDFLNK